VDRVSCNGEDAGKEDEDGGKEQGEGSMIRQRATSSRVVEGETDVAIKEEQGEGLSTGRMSTTYTRAADAPREVEISWVA